MEPSCLEGARPGYRGTINYCHKFVGIVATTNHGWVG
jgi:hypothetical protein